MLERSRELFVLGRLGRAAERSRHRGEIDVLDRGEDSDDRHASHDE
jgi:hypothetical protein